MYKPCSLYNFIGQKEIVEDLMIGVETLEYPKSLEHTLFCGPPGLGKTTLGKVIADTLGGNFIFKTGPNLTKKQELMDIFFRLGNRDVFLIDEIHSLKKLDEMLYSPMQDFKWEGVPLNQFTLIGTTTSAGQLKKPLLDRFINLYELDLYTIEELSAILFMNGAELYLTKPVCTYIAQRSKGTPRLALNFSLKVIKLKIYANITIEESARAVFKKLGIDDFGLSSKDRKVLGFLAQHGASELNKGIGAETIAFALNLDKSDLVNLHEPWLLYLDFIMRTPRGRIITPKGLSYVAKFC